MKQRLLAEGEIRERPTQTSFASGPPFAESVERPFDLRWVE